MLHKTKGRLAAVFFRFVEHEFFELGFFAMTMRDDGLWCTKLAIFVHGRAKNKASVHKKGAFCAPNAI